MQRLGVVNPWADLPDISPWRLRKWDDVYTGPNYEVSKLNNLIADAIEHGTEVIRIPPGIYHIRETSEHVFEPVVLIDGAENLEIDARDVVLMAHVKCQPIRLRKCKNVILRGLTIDYAPEALPYTQGTVESVAAGGIQVRLHEGYPDLPVESGTLRKGATYDPETLQLKDNVHTILNPSFDKIGHRRYRIANRFRGTQEGDYVTLIYGIGPHSLMIQRSEEVTIHAVTIHAAHMFCSRGDYNHDVTYRGVKITPGPMLPATSVPRLKSGNQDGINNHISSRILVSGCLVEAHSDDAVTLYDDDMVPVLKAGDGYVLMPRMHNKSVVEVGQTIRFLNEKTSGLRGHATVAEITDADGEVSEQEWRNVISSMGRIFRPERMTGAVRVQLEKMQGEVQPGDWGYARYSEEGIVITGNRFRNARGRGVVVKTNNSVIADNIIERSDTFGIFARHEGYWLSPGHVENFVIRNNLIRGIGTRPSQPTPTAAIVIDSKGSSGYAPAGMHRNISIVNNTFEHIYQLPVMITSASEVSISNNAFVDTHFRKVVNRWRTRDDHRRILWMKNVSDVTVRNNVIRDAGSQLHEEPIYVDTGEAMYIEAMRRE